jgi:hypothetical protein
MKMTVTRFRRVGHVQNEIVIEVALLNRSVLDRDLAEHRHRKTVVDLRRVSLPF